MAAKEVVFPDPLDPYVYPARVHRVIDGDSIKLHLDQGFGDWKLCTIHPGSEKEARYPQGVYQLAGIGAPEKHRAAGLEAMARVNELLSLGKSGDSILVKSNKEKLHYTLDLYVPIDPPGDGIDYAAESAHWLDEVDLKSLVVQTDPIGASTVRAMATELLARRKTERSVFHVNQQLLDEGLAVPCLGGKKK